MALAWTLRDPRVTSTLIGASSVEQLEANVGALEKLDFSPEELEEIDRYAVESGINLWAAVEQRVIGPERCLQFPNPLSGTSHVRGA